MQISEICKNCATKPPNVDKKSSALDFESEISVGKSPAPGAEQPTLGSEAESCTMGCFRTKFDLKPLQRA